ncbi:MAG: helix-turn-helix domain-containing protein [Candidatus Sulfotelmatobacter sp.]
MFSVPIDNLTWNDVNSFCQARPREGLILDYKLDFPRRLDKTIASFANTYGGHVLIGVDETVTGEPVLPVAGVPLQEGLRERVVAIALGSIYPPVYPEVRVVEFRSSDAVVAPDRAVIVIRVHESDAGAHAVDGGKSVYLRVDNISDQFTRQATIEEMEWLLNKRQKSVDLKERLLREAIRRAANHLPTYRAAGRLPTDEPRGKYILWTVPTFPRAELTSPQRLLALSRTWRVRVANFSFPTGDAEPIAGGVRHPRTPVMNYWYTEVNRFGLVYTEIGFTGRGGEHRDAITCDLIATLMVANLRFSMNLYESIGYFGLVDFHFDVAPTLNRYPFLSIALEGHLTENRSLEDRVSLAFTSSVKEIRDSLVQRSREKYREFMWAFGLDVSDGEASGHFTSFGIS